MNIKHFNQSLFCQLDWLSDVSSHYLSFHIYFQMLKLKLLKKDWKELFFVEMQNILRFVEYLDIWDEKLDFYGSVEADILTKDMFPHIQVVRFGKKVK